MRPPGARTVALSRSASKNCGPLSTNNLDLPQKWTPFILFYCVSRGPSIVIPVVSAVSARPPQ